MPAPVSAAVVVAEERISTTRASAAGTSSGSGVAVSAPGATISGRGNFTGSRLTPPVWTSPGELADLRPQRVRHPREVRLLAGRTGDDGHLLAHRLDLPGDPLDRPAGLGRRVDGGAELRVNVRGGPCRLVGQRPHLVGDDGEPPPGVPGTRGLDGRVEREHPGLGGDLADERDGL